MIRSTIDLIVDTSEIFFNIYSCKDIYGYSLSLKLHYICVRLKLVPDVTR